MTKRVFILITILALPNIVNCLVVGERGFIGGFNYSLPSGIDAEILVALIIDEEEVIIDATYETSYIPESIEPFKTDITYIYNNLIEKLANEYKATTAYLHIVKENGYSSISCQYKKTSNWKQKCDILIN